MGSLVLAERLQDKLSSDLTRYVELTEAAVFRISQADAPAHRAPKVATPKESIELLTLDVDERVSIPGSLAKRQPKTGTPGLVIVSGIEVNGTCFIGMPGQSPAQALAHSDSQFFAVTDAELSFTSSDLQITTKVALIARSKVTNLAF